MNIESVSKLIEIADSLFFEKTKRSLEKVEKDILRQILLGKKYDEIQAGSYSQETIKKYWIPKLWERLEIALGGKRIRKGNVLRELRQLKLQQELSVNMPRIHISSKARNQLNAGVIVNSLESNLNGVNCYINLDSSNENSVGTNTYTAETGKQKTEDYFSALIFNQVPGSERTFRANKYKTNGDWRTFMRLIRTGGLSLLIAIGFLGCLFGFSWLADWYGAENHEEGKLPQAELGYRIATSFNPWSSSAHYNLGAVYEDQQNYQLARTEYQRAMELGEVAAYNNQARLYLLEGKSDTAVALLQTGMPMISKENTSIRYSFLKNLGWARLLQGRLEEAEVELNDAIAVAGDRAAAYCLLAQVKENRGKTEQANLEWENCLRYSRLPRTPEEDNWMSMAQQKLKARGDNK